MSICLLTSLEGGPAQRAEWVNIAAPEGIPPTASVWLRLPHPLWAFALLPIFPSITVVLLVSRSTFPYFLFLLHVRQFPVLSVLSRTSHPKILLSMPTSGLSSKVLPFTSLYPFLLAFPYPVLPMFVPHFFSQNPVKHARSRSLAFFPFPPVLPFIVDYTSIVSALFYLPLLFYWYFPKNVFVLDDLFYLFGSCLSNVVFFLWI